MLDKTERLCKWLLLIILLLSLIVPLLLIHELNLTNTYYVFDALLFFMLGITSVQSLIGLIAWGLLCRFHTVGRRMFIGTYTTSLAGYGMYGLYLLFTLFLPDTVIFPLEVYSILSLFALSAVILVLQYFWSRYF